MEGKILEKYGVRFNRYGMINSFEDALPMFKIFDLDRYRLKNAIGLHG